MAAHVETALPVVQVSNVVRGGGLPFVGVDYRTAYSFMTGFLISMGLKSLAHISGHLDHVEDARERKRGFLIHDEVQAGLLKFRNTSSGKETIIPASGSEAAKRCSGPVGPAYSCLRGERCDGPCVCERLRFGRSVGTQGCVCRRVRRYRKPRVLHSGNHDDAPASRRTGSLGGSRPSSATGKRFRGNENHKRST